MSVAIPTPGGAKVGLSKFAVISAGAAVGVYLAGSNMDKLPAWAYQWNIGPVGGMHFILGVGAVLGGAAGAMIASKF